MLALTRYVGQTICIGGDIRVTVMRMKGSRDVVIGIEAPDSVGVKRAAVVRSAQGSGRRRRALPSAGVVCDNRE